MKVRRRYSLIVREDILMFAIVFEWDTSDHQEGYDLWLKAVLADGGNSCRALTDLIGEPLIKGMLVGTEATFLKPEERVAVSTFSPNSPPRQLERS